MAPKKKGKARAQVQAPQEGEELAPIPEDPVTHEGWDGYAPGGEAGQNETWADGDGYGTQDQWGYTPGSQAGGWETTQYQQQDWAGQTISPAVNAQAPAETHTWTNWGRNPQGAYGAPRAPRAAAGTAQQPAASTRPGYDAGENAGGSGWQNWGAEAAANSYPYPQHSQRAPGPGPSYDQQYQQYRVPMGGNDPYAPIGGERVDMTPQAQRMIYESIQHSQGGAPKQQRSGRSPARKQLKKSKKERKAQAHNSPIDWGEQEQNQGWGQGQDNSGWGGGDTGWDQQDVERGGKDASAWDQWGGAEEADLDGDGYTDSDGWNDVTGRRNVRRTTFVPRLIGDSPYPMRSRTMAYARGDAEEGLDAFSPRLSRRRNTINDYSNMEFLESYGEAFKPVESAFFGRERKARDRIHWQFPHDKDERVRDALEWLRDNAHGVGAFGLNKFLHTRERGALFINASYNPQAGAGPAFDWLTYDDVVETRDRLLQESVGFYDPAMQTIVFVFLPSKTGNSLAMWRRKVAVPDGVRRSQLQEIELAKAALRKDYPVWVDEIRLPPYRPSSSPPPKKKKKKGFFRRLFRIFKIVW